MQNKTYDVLKFIAQIVLPSLATAYFTLANIWGLPYAKEIVGTITVIDTFLGAILGISTSKYKKELSDPEYLTVLKQQEKRTPDTVDYTEGEK